MRDWWLGVALVAGVRGTGAPRGRLGARFAPCSAVVSGVRGRYSVPGGAAYAVTVEPRQHGGILTDG